MNLKFYYNRISNFKLSSEIFFDIVDLFLKTIFLKIILNKKLLNKILLKIKEIINDIFKKFHIWGFFWHISKGLKPYLIIIVFE